MFTVDQLFSQCFPILTGISLDVGTVMSGMILILFIVIGFDFVKGALFHSYYMRREETLLNLSDEYFDNARMYGKGSAMYRQSMALGNHYMRKSMDYHFKERGSRRFSSYSRKMFDNPIEID